MTAVIGVTKASSFFGVLHHAGHRLGRYRYHFESNVVFELLYGIWLVGINFTLQKSLQKNFCVIKSSSNQILVASQYRFFQHCTSRDIGCPPKFPDLIPQKFFLWRFLKCKIYANKPKTIEELKNYIRGDVAEISPETLVNVMENAKKRARFCLSNDGGHLIDAVFKN